MNPKKLECSGVRFNEWKLSVIPNRVSIENSNTKFFIPMNRFKAFAEWYLTDQVTEYTGKDLLAAWGRDNEGEG